MMLFAVVLLCAAASVAAKECGYERPEECYTWQERWYEGMPIDHFSYGDQRTFRLRYLINTQWFDAQNSGPIFFYAGNELSIENFANASGFMWDEAPKFNAMLLFIEHRYYGKSLPFGPESGSSLENLQHLSGEQALADFAQVITYVKDTILGARQSPVIAFGGSYGAILAGWMRIKYPHIVVGAFSSSGPVWQLGGLAPCWAHGAIVTKDFAQGAPGCDDRVRRSWPALRRLAATDSGRRFLNQEFKMCPDEQVQDVDGVASVIGLIESSFDMMAMLNYPYPTWFVKPLPTYPVTEACKRMMSYAGDSDEQLASGIHAAMTVFYNHTGELKCLTAAAANDGFGWWPFQTCTEQVLPICHNGTDMFEVSLWNATDYSDSCAKQFWGVRPRFDWPTINFGGRALTWATNIIFRCAYEEAYGTRIYSNGDMDPWYGGGVTTAYPGMQPSVHIINIPHAAHHLELRAAHPLDPVWVKNARRQIRGIFRKWVQYKL